MARHYYTARLNDGATETGVEEILGRVETTAIPVLKQLASGADPGTLSDDERAMTAFHIALQTVRVPRFRTSVEQMISTVMAKVSIMTANHPAAFARTMREDQ